MRTSKKKCSVIFAVAVFAAVLNLNCTGKIFLSGIEHRDFLYPMYGKSPQRSFYIPNDIGDSLKLKWKSKINGSFSSTSVTAIDKYVFVPDLSGRIYAFNTGNGQEIGNIKYKGIISQAPVICGSDLVFVVSEKNNGNSTLYFYDFIQGKESSSYEIKGNVQTELIELESEIIYITEEGKVGKISQGDGKLWEFDTKSYIHSSPVLINNSLMFGDDKGEIYSINVITGKLNYKTKIGNGFTGGFTTSEDIVYSSDVTGKTFALSPKDGHIIWDHIGDANINTIPVIDDKFIYLNNLRGEIFKLDKTNGKLIWKISTGGLLNTTPLIFSDYILQPDLNKKVYFIKKQDGKISKIIHYENRVKLTPVFFNNTLFLGTDNGQVFAYEQVNH